MAAGRTIIHGKKVAKSAVTNSFLHRITAHSEPRVVRKLHCAWADAEEWMVKVVSDEPCEQCLQGNASRLGPSGSLPTVDGLVFIDVHHTNVEPHDRSGRNVLGVKHAKSGFTKTVRMPKKSDAPDAIMLCYGYFNSVGKAWTWIHCDGAGDLKGSKVGALAKKHGWRITTTNVGSSNKAEGAEELVGYADSDWSTTRSTTAFLIMLGGAAIAHASRRQHCITMSSCEAELVALADLAIEMLYIMALLTFIGYEVKKPIKCYTDNKGAYDLCHRFTSAQNSRHIDRKLFKMREMRGASLVRVIHVPTELNTADLLTKILPASIAGGMVPVAGPLIGRAMQAALRRTATAHG